MTTSLRLLLALSGLVLPVQDGELDPLLASGAVQTLELRSPPGTRVEHFRLDRDVPGADPVGLVRLVVGPDTEGLAPGQTGVRLESETLFFGPEDTRQDTRVVHAERLRFDGPAPDPAQTLVWREIRPQAGRTVLFERTPEGIARSSETLGGEILRRVHREDRPVHLPLALVEAARAGELSGGRYGVFQPLSSSLEVLSVGVHVDLSSGSRERVLELFRPEGDSAGRYVFRGERLVGFQLQAGGLRASPLSRVDYERLLATRVEEESGGLSEALRPGPAGG